MPFTLSPATEADIPGLLHIWISAFPTLDRTFPTTPAGEAWKRKSFENTMRNPPLGCVHMVVTEDSDAGRKVVAFARWFKYGEGEWDPDWRTRWEPQLAEGMKEETVGEGFFYPMARQHRAVMEERPHWFLEILATDQEYQKQGHGSKLLEWGAARADGEGLEIYVDASRKGQPLYEKFGFVEHAEMRISKDVSAPMCRPAKK